MVLTAEQRFDLQLVKETLDKFAEKHKARYWVEDNGFSVKMRFKWDYKSEQKTDDRSY